MKIITQAILTLVLSIVISVSLAHYDGVSRFKDMFTSEFKSAFPESVAAMVKEAKENTQRVPTRIISVGRSVFCSLPSDMGVLGVNVSPMLLDVGANSKITLNVLNTTSVTFKDVTIKVELSVKQADGKVTWKTGTYSTTMKTLYPSKWTSVVLDVPNTSTKDISSIYIKAADINSVEEFSY